MWLKSIFACSQVKRAGKVQRHAERTRREREPDMSIKQYDTLSNDTILQLAHRALQAYPACLHA